MGFKSAFKCLKKATKKTIGLYNIVAAPALLCGCQDHTSLRQQRESVGEVFRLAAGCELYE